MALAVAKALAVPVGAHAGQAISADIPVSHGRPISHLAIAADPATLCETAITTAEYLHRLPPRLLGAISLAETGRPDAATGRPRPWPWSVNAEQEGRFFATREAAIDAVRVLQARGVRSIDVGCLQVNLMYHPHAFASLQAAFEPRDNADYAANFLNALYAAGQDWSRAIAAYHSETPALGDAYRLAVEARWRKPDLPAAPRLPAYADFANSDFAQADRAYAAFTQSALIYRAFPQR